MNHQAVTWRFTVRSDVLAIGFLPREGAVETWRRLIYGCWWCFSPKTMEKMVGSLQIIGINHHINWLVRLDHHQVNWFLGGKNISSRNLTAAVHLWNPLGSSLEWGSLSHKWVYVSHVKEYKSWVLRLTWKTAGKWPQDMSIFFMKRRLRKGDIFEAKDVVPRISSSSSKSTLKIWEPKIWVISK